MDYGWEFFWSVIASSAGTTLLLGVVGWLCRGQISHWLNKDLEAAKAKHQQELEAYKVSLIAATERSKANQELKKTGALRVLDMKFGAMTALHKASLGLYAEVMTAAEAHAGSKGMEGFRHLAARREALRDAILGASVFLDHEQIAVLYRYRTLVGNAVDFCLPNAAPPSDGGASMNSSKTQRSKPTT
ncbi:hypothetical protein [Variovorax boronicumulans]|uniref:hypothetical protein n=1 Tax=Variovorax boronicumulans TaxID=436515 RepID=UPI0012FD2BEF|nr:hypothetical protein [Variovorax boronicumulans]